MKSVLILPTSLVLLLTMGSTAQEAALSEQEDETTASVTAFLQTYAKAFNQRNIEALKPLWAPDASHDDLSLGIKTEGRAAILADLAKVFERQPKIRMTGRAEAIRLITPDVAKVSGETRVTAPGEEPGVATFSAILIKKDHNWCFAAVEERDVQVPNSPAEALAELEWLIGLWVDASDSVRVETTFRWSANKNFLLRSYVVTDAGEVRSQGTQVIGWDPRTMQIRSWSFDSDGSFGNGVWSKSDRDWVCRSTRTLADGRLASGTYLISQSNAETMSIRLIGLVIEGEPQPAGDPVTVVRIVEPDTAPKDRPDPTPPTKN